MAYNPQTDNYHITVVGVNPHDVAVQLDEPDNPFDDDIGHPGVYSYIFDEDNTIVGGVVDVWASEHLTSGQQQWLDDNPNVIDVRHVWPD